VEVYQPVVDYLLHILREIDQALLLVISLVLLFFFSFSFIHDIVVSWRKMSAKEISLYAILAFGTGRLAAEGLLNCWQYWT
jgi:hypothetical protein